MSSSNSSSNPTLPLGISAVGCLVMIFGMIGDGVPWVVLGIVMTGAPWLIYLALEWGRAPRRRPRPDDKRPSDSGAPLMVGGSSGSDSGGWFSGSGDGCSGSGSDSGGGGDCGGGGGGGD